MASHPVHLVHPVEILGVSTDNTSIVNNLDATPLELPVELVSLKDLEQIPQLMAGFARSVKKGEEFKVKI
jgi:hypothetical protein